MEHSEAELKSLVTELINKYINFIGAESIRDVLNKLIAEHYDKGLQHAEVKFNMNFTPDYKRLSFLQGYGFENVKGLDEEIKDKLRKEMSMGLMNNESITELKDRIVKVMDTSIERAKLITTTEVNRAFNMGNYQAAQESGLELKKQWSAQAEKNSDNPCPICEEMHGVVVGIDEKFKFSDGEELLLPPKHPRCKCRIKYLQKHDWAKLKAEDLGWRTNKDGGKFNIYYHGTSKQNKDSILRDGFKEGAVYFTTNKDYAKEFYGEHLIEAELDLGKTKETTQSDMHQWEKVRDEGYDSMKFMRAGRYGKIGQADTIGIWDAKRIKIKSFEFKDIQWNGMTGHWITSRGKHLFVTKEGKFYDGGGKEVTMDDKTPPKEEPKKEKETDRTKLHANFFMGHKGKWENIGGKHVFVASDEDGVFFGINGKKLNMDDLNESLNKEQSEEDVYEQRKRQIEEDDRKREEARKSDTRNPADMVKDIHKAAKESNFSLKEQVNLGNSGRSMAYTHLMEKAGMSRDKTWEMGGAALYLAYKEEILDYAANFKNKFSNDIPREVLDRMHGTNNLLRWLGYNGLQENKGDGMGTSRLNNFIENLRDKTGNDVKQINLVLGYMGSKVRVKKEGERANAQKKTASEIASSLDIGSMGGITYKISPAFVKNTKSFKNMDELKAQLSKAINMLPKKAKEEIEKGGTKIHFVTRPEAKKISAALASNRTAGYYMPGTKQVFILPEKSQNRSFNIDENDFKESGYSDDMIKKLRWASEKENWVHVVVHELAHATALNRDENTSPKDPIPIQNKYNAFISNYIEKTGVRDETITDYAMTNRKEDFAETFAYYARHKQIIDNAIEKDESWTQLVPSLREKFKWMRDNIWA